MDPQELDRVLTNHLLWKKSSGRQGAKAKLQGADLRWADMEGADLQGADLRWANLEGASLQGTNLYCANLRWASLQEANLYCANLRGADLEGVNLRGTNLRGADLRGAVGIPDAADAAARLRAVAAAATANDDNLEMDTWHTCQTTHCIAGWAISLAGEPGRLLEEMHGPELAGRMLLGHEAANHFHDTNEDARAWLLSILNS